MVAPVRRESGPPRRYGLVSSYSPTACGIATFSTALVAGLVRGGRTVDVIRCGPAVVPERDPIVGSLDGRTVRSVAAAASALNITDVVIIQHEYGLYDGPDGEQILELLRALHVPVIVVAHTVVHQPLTNQRRVLRGVCEAADAVVVMTSSARSRLIHGYDIDPSKVSVIAHGAATEDTPTNGDAADLPWPVAEDSVRILTWGLLGPGKGIEWAIEALAMLEDLTPTATYLVAGATHPKVKEHSGEAYRRMLAAHAETVGVGGSVRFDDGYRELGSLNRLIRSADMVILPYDSPDQVTSGVLVDAVAAGRPVIATAFPHAVELLSGGAGIVVPRRDPSALAGAIRSIATEPGRAEAMRGVARHLSRQLAWPFVAQQYADLAARVAAVHERAIA